MGDKTGFSQTQSHITVAVHMLVACTFKQFFCDNNTITVYIIIYNIMCSTVCCIQIINIALCYNFFFQ